MEATSPERENLLRNNNREKEHETALKGGYTSRGLSCYFDGKGVDVEQEK
jgi:hypothetical protein